MNRRSLKLSSSFSFSSPSPKSSPFYIFEGLQLPRDLVDSAKIQIKSSLFGSPDQRLPVPNSFKTIYYLNSQRHPVMRGSSPLSSSEKQAADASLSYYGIPKSFANRRYCLLFLEGVALLWALYEMLLNQEVSVSPFSPNWRGFIITPFIPESPENLVPIQSLPSLPHPAVFPNAFLEVILTTFHLFSVLNRDLISIFPASNISLNTYTCLLNLLAVGVEELEFMSTCLKLGVHFEWKDDQVVSLPLSRDGEAVFRCPPKVTPGWFLKPEPSPPPLETKRPLYKRIRSLFNSSSSSFDPECDMTASKKDYWRSLYRNSIGLGCSVLLDGLVETHIECCRWNFRESRRKNEETAY